MKKRSYRNSKNKYSRNSRYNNDTKPSLLGPQFSACIILCIFVLIIANVNTIITKNIRKTTSDIISTNALQKYKDTGNIKENISHFVECMFTFDNSESDSAKINDDMDIEIKNDVSANAAINSTINDIDNTDNVQEAMQIIEGWIDPVDKGIISSLCGTRLNPVLNVDEYHNGIDIASDEGSNVYAVRSGTVTNIRYSETYGNVLEYETNDDFKIIYCHLSEIAVEIGDEVIQGDIVAYVGSTGLTTGPHLHYSVYMGTMLMNPIQFTSYT